MQLEHGDQVAYSPVVVAEMTGLDVKTIERAIHRGALSAKKYGRLYRIGAVELDQWLEDEPLAQ